jgi:hypothetical protein
MYQFFGVLNDARRWCVSNCPQGTFAWFRSACSTCVAPLGLQHQQHPAIANECRRSRMNRAVSVAKNSGFVVVRETADTPAFLFHATLLCTKVQTSGTGMRNPGNKRQCVFYRREAATDEPTYDGEPHQTRGLGCRQWALICQPHRASPRPRRVSKYFSKHPSL